MANSAPSKPDPAQAGSGEKAEPEARKPLNPTVEPLGARPKSRPLKPADEPLGARPKSRPPPPLTKEDLELARALCAKKSEK